MGKLDIKHAFRLCPVHPADWCLLGYKWDGRYFVDTRLPFGSRSSPFIFNQFAEALIWILRHVYGMVRCVVHYLDDFFVCGENFQRCSASMNKIKHLFELIGVPLALDKVLGPSTTLTYWGIEIDSVARCIRLPPAKLMDLQTILLNWSTKEKCTKRELLSLIGSLSFACKVVKPGRIFLRRLIDLSTSVSRLNHHIRINSEARKDIMWWKEFIYQWNGVELFQNAPISSSAMQLFTDASFLGFGAAYKSSWFSCPWPSRVPSTDINYLELFAVAAALFTWGSEWRNQQILFGTDNASIVAIWSKGSCKDKDIMRLVRALFFFCTKHTLIY